MPIEKPKDPVNNNAISAGQKYDIANYMYPIDAETNPETPHTVVFYINVRGNSIAKKSDNTLYELTDAQSRAQVTGEGMAKSGTAAAGAALAGVAGNVAKSYIKSLTDIASTKKIADGYGAGSIKSATIGAKITGIKDALKVVGSSAAVGLTALDLGVTRMYRLKDAITLAVQEPMKTSYNVEYEDFDVGTLMGGMSSDKASVMGMVEAGILKGAQIPSVIGAPDFSRGIQKMAGTAINPFKTVLFKQVDLRNFTFNYKFMPRSKKEASNVLDIIKTFKYHMHPEFAADKVFLTHPSEFNIIFYYKGVENDNWNKISTCVLTNLEVDAGTEQLASFEDGMSVEINMKLSFKETEMLTKRQIAEGY